MGIYNTAVLVETVNVLSPEAQWACIRFEVSKVDNNYGQDELELRAWGGGKTTISLVLPRAQKHIKG